MHLQVLITKLEVSSCCNSLPHVSSCPSLVPRQPGNEAKLSYSGDNRTISVDRISQIPREPLGLGRRLVVRPRLVSVPDPRTWEEGLVPRLVSFPKL